MSRGVRKTHGSSTDSSSDVDLIARIHDGDDRAFEALVQRFGRLVYRVAVDILRDGGEAEDVAQEVFLDIHRKAHLYDPSRGSVRTWLLQYAYHRTLRRKSTLRRRAAYRGESLDEIHAVGDDLRQRLSREECRWVICAGLAQLPERQRTTLELTCFEDLSLRDVAERLRVSLGSARHYYYRGLAKLRDWAAIEGAGDQSSAGAVRSTPPLRERIS